MTIYSKMYDSKGWRRLRCCAALLALPVLACATTGGSGTTAGGLGTTAGGFGTTAGGLGTIAGRFGKTTVQRTFVERAHAAPLAGYLAQLERQIAPRWSITVQELLALRAKEGGGGASSPSSLVTAVEVELDELGRPAAARVQRSSGWHLFDYHAKLLLDGARWPVAPELGERRLVLSWHFFADGRGCSRRYVEARQVALTPVAALRRALARGDTARALHWVQGASPEVVGAVVERGLQDPRPSVQKLALRLVSTKSLEQRLRDHRGAEPRWRAALDEAVRRRARLAVRGALEQLGRPLYSWHPPSAAEGGAQDTRLAALLHAARRLQIAIPAPVLAFALQSRSAGVLRAALPSCHDGDRLLPLLERSGQQDTAFGLRALVRALAASKGSPDRRALAHLRRHLRGRDARLRRAVLGALVESPLPALLSSVLEAPPAAAPEDRALRLRALARLGGDALPLYRNLMSRHAVVRLAAIEALGRHPGAGLGAAYRLVTQAYHAPEPFRSAAIVAMVRIGHPRMSKDVAFLVQRLPLASKRALAPRLAALGPRALSVLALLGKITATARPASRPATPSAHALLQRLVSALVTQDANS